MKCLPTKWEGPVCIIVSDRNTEPINHRSRKLGPKGYRPVAGSMTIPIRPRGIPERQGERAI